MRKNKFLFVYIIFYNFIFYSISQAELPQPILKIYTNRSFARGIGKSAKEIFEKTYDCKIEYLNEKSPLNTLLALPTMKNKPDLLVEISYDILQSLDDKTKEQIFLPLKFEKTNIILPINWEDKFFLPLSYSILSFIYDSQKVKSPPHSFEDLKKIDHKIILIDPRTSNPGFGLLLWIKKVYGKNSEAFWKDLKPKILTITKGWSEAASLFLKGEAPIMLGYASSPAYYRLIEKKTHLKTSLFSEGQYLQISVGAVLKNTAHPRLAKKFLELLLSQELQKKMMYEYWVYPVVKISDSLPEEFQAVKKVLPPLLPEEVKEHKKAWIREWLNGLS